MTWHRGEFRTTQQAHKRRYAIMGIGVAALVVVTGTTVAVAANASERSAQLEIARSSAQLEVGNRVGIGASGLDIAETRLTVEVDGARAELGRAAATLALGAGKATDASLATLRQGIDALTAEADSAGLGSSLLSQVFSLRAAQKAVTDSVADWQRAEDARLAAEVAAAQAAEPGAAFVSADSWSAPSSSSSRSSSGGSSSGEPAAVKAAPAPVAASVDYGTPPANDNCGPCPGATLVPIVWDGVTYWGCP
ncbi:hypothetical protein [Luethyella okanaganae]|uniref:Uncharacterized protein n=1 Tax=Luethyella okanaganae TaxID=69372 RepID=A0ABW1VDX2_9MICO